MSCVCILTPVVIVAWPAFSAAVLSAAASLGYQVVAQAQENFKETEASKNRPRQVTLEVPQSEIVTGQLHRDQQLSVCREGVTVTFSRDARGKAALCVTGTGRTDEALRAAGEELSGRVVQRYVYQRLLEEMRARQFLVVEEETDLNQAIRLKVRLWEN